jgi:hypothetical protein
MLTRLNAVGGMRYQGYREDLTLAAHAIMRKLNGIAGSSAVRMRMAPAYLLRIVLTKAGKIQGDNVLIPPFTHLRFSIKRRLP